MISKPMVENVVDSFLNLSGIGDSLNELIVLYRKEVVKTYNMDINTEYAKYSFVVKTLFKMCNQVSGIMTPKLKSKRIIINLGNLLVVLDYINADCQMVSIIKNNDKKVENLNKLKDLLEQVKMTIS